MNRNDICSQLRELRKKRGLNTSQFADMCGLTQPAISKLERGQWSFGIDTLCKVTDALGVKIEFVEKDPYR